MAKGIDTQKFTKMYNFLRNLIIEAITSGKIDAFFQNELILKEDMPQFVICWKICEFPLKTSPNFKEIVRNY